MDELRTKLKRVLQRTRVLLTSRRHAYKFVFGGAFGSVVLKDLTKFCRGNETTFDSDPRVHALLEGRREVLLRIAQHLNLSVEELWALYDGRVEPDE